MAAPPPEQALQRLREVLGVVRSGTEVRRYKLGTYRAVVFGDLTVSGTLKIPHAVALFETKDAPPVLVVFAEERKAASFYGSGSHGLVCWIRGHRTAHGDSDAWATLDSFERKALELAASQLGVTEPPKRLKPKDEAHAPAAPRAAPVEEPAAQESPPSLPPPRPSMMPAMSSSAKAGVGAIGGLGIVFIAIKVLVKIGATSMKLDSSYTPPSNYHLPSTYQSDDIASLQPDGTFDPIAVDEESVYWASRADKRVYASPKASGEPRVLDESPGRVTGLAVDDEHVYLTRPDSRKGASDAGVYRIAKQGGPPERIGTALNRAAGPIVSRGFLFYLEGISVDGMLDRRITYGSIVAVPTGGGRQSRYVSSSEAIPSFAVDDGFVYWIPWKDGKVAVAPLREGMDASKPAKLPVLGQIRADAGDGEPRAVEVAVDARNVYVTLDWPEGEFSIERMPKDGSAGSAVARVDGSIRGLAVQGGEAWWIQAGGDEDLGSVYRSGAKGKPPVKVAEGLPSTARMALDSSAVYWTTPNGIESAPRSGMTAADAGAGKGTDGGSRDAAKAGPRRATDAGGACGGTE